MSTWYLLCVTRISQIYHTKRIGYQKHCHWVDVAQTLNWLIKKIHSSFWLLIFLFNPMFFVTILLSLYGATCIPSLVKRHLANRFVVELRQMRSRVTDIDRHRRRIDNVNLSHPRAAHAVVRSHVARISCEKLTSVYTDEKDVSCC